MTTNHISDTTADKNRQNWCTPNWYVMGPWGGEGTFSRMCVQFNIVDVILIFVPNTWVTFWVHGKKNLQNSWFYPKYLCQTFGRVIRLDCCLRGGGYKLKNVCTIQHSWFCPDFCAEDLGELSSWIVVFGPLRGVRAQFKKCVYNSTFLILSWYFCQTFGGVIKFDLLSLGQTHNC